MGEAYIYHYIEYKFLHLPKEVRITKYKGGPLDGEVEEVTVYHKNKRFAKHVDPMLPYKKQLIKIPLSNKDFTNLYKGDIKKITEHDDECLKKLNLPKNVRESVAISNILAHYSEINRKYAELKPKK